MLHVARGKDCLIVPLGEYGHDNNHNHIGRLVGQTINLARHIPASKLMHSTFLRIIYNIFMYGLSFIGNSEFK